MWHKTSEKEPPNDKSCLVYLPESGYGTHMAKRRIIFYPEGNKPRWHCFESPSFQEMCNQPDADPLWALMPEPSKKYEQ